MRFLATELNIIRNHFYNLCSAIIFSLHIPARYLGLDRVTYCGPQSSARTETILPLEKNKKEATYSALARLECNLCSTSVRCPSLDPCDCSLLTLPPLALPLCAGTEKKAASYRRRVHGVFVMERMPWFGAYYLNMYTDQQRLECQCLQTHRVTPNSGSWWM